MVVTYNRQIQQPHEIDINMKNVSTCLMRLRTLKDLILIFHCRFKIKALIHIHDYQNFL